MSAFADLFAEVALPQLFEQLGEAVTYTIGGGSGASITAVIAEIDGPEEQGQSLTNMTERLEVIVGRDPADATYGGVEQPRIGDKLTRTSSGLVYAFTGRTLKGNAGCWKLEFARPRPRTIGRT